VLPLTSRFFFLYSALVDERLRCACIVFPTASVTLFELSSFFCFIHLDAFTTFALLYSLWIDELYLSFLPPFVFLSTFPNKKSTK
jgi:hypothetical protein